MSLHDLKFLDGQASRREKDVVGDPDLSDVVQSGRARQELHLLRRVAELLCKERGHLSHPAGVLARIVIVAILLPHYFRGDLYTAYELMQRRFGTSIRKVTSMTFLVTRSLAEGVRVFAVSISAISCSPASRRRAGSAASFVRSVSIQSP